MIFLEIYIGLCIIFFLITLILLKSAPTGWEDKYGFHLGKENERNDQSNRNSTQIKSIKKAG
jgi:hypothetical protein